VTVSVGGRDAADGGGRVSRSQSSSPLRHLTRTAFVTAAASAAAAGGGGVTSSSWRMDVDLVSIQTALRRFSKQLITAEIDRVSGAADTSSRSSSCLLICLE